MVAEASSRIPNTVSSRRHPSWLLDDLASGAVRAAFVAPSVCDKVPERCACGCYHLSCVYDVVVGGGSASATLARTLEEPTDARQTLDIQCTVHVVGQYWPSS